MLKDRTIAVVVPAYNEEKQIGRVIETMPDFVDRIIIINDKSMDKTAEVVKKYIADSKYNSTKVGLEPQKVERNFYNEAEVVLHEKNKQEIKFFVDSEIVNEKPEINRIILINQKKNSGNGAGISRGLKWVKDNEIDAVAIMDGDGQMDPNELESIVYPIVQDNVDYVKGNRLLHGSSWLIIPKVRFIGNSILSILNKLASGYWKISDTQTGYVAMSKKAINSIRLYDIYRSYGWPNDLLVKMNIAFCTIREIEIKPVYNLGEKSKMKVLRVIPKISWLLLRSFLKRLYIKYLFRDFHPLFLLYHAAAILLVTSLPFLYKILRLAIIGEGANPVTVLAFFFLFVTGFQSLLFAMWMDIQDNDRLYK
ncbi:MAG: glycosyltransferase family 2 protein [Ignavibacteria bacterium]|jgi:glycosyltransferase involved in cell wall biosynthesis